MEIRPRTVLEMARLIFFASIRRSVEARASEVRLALTEEGSGVRTAS